jgi:hypothetical protein
MTRLEVGRGAAVPEAAAFARRAERARGDKSEGAARPPAAVTLGRPPAVLPWSAPFFMAWNPLCRTSVAPRNLIELGICARLLLHAFEFCGHGVMAWHDLCFVDNYLESAWQTGIFSDFCITTFFTTYKNVVENVVM